MLVCFNCRKSWKAESWSGFSSSFTDDRKCQTCGGVAYGVGSNFKAPKKNNLKQWKKVRLLFERGYFGKRKAWSGSKYMYLDKPLPKTLGEARNFVKPQTDEERFRWDLIGT